jgi:hypothetical protein
MAGHIRLYFRHRRRAIREAHAVKTYRRRIRDVAARGTLVPYYPSILLVWLSVINPSAHCRP